MTIIWKRGRRPPAIASDAMPAEMCPQKRRFAKRLVLCAAFCLAAGAAFAKNNVVSILETTTIGECRSENDLNFRTLDGSNKLMSAKAAAKWREDALSVSFDRFFFQNKFGLGLDMAVGMDFLGALICDYLGVDSDWVNVDGQDEISCDLYDRVSLSGKIGLIFNWKISDRADFYMTPAFRANYIHANADIHSFQLDIDKTADFHALSLLFDFSIGAKIWIDKFGFNVGLNGAFGKATAWKCDILSDLGVGAAGGKALQGAALVFGVCWRF